MGTWSYIGTINIIQQFIYKAPPKKTDERDERQRVHASTVFFGGAFQTKCSKKSYVYRGEVKNGRKSAKI